MFNKIKSLREKMTSKHSKARPVLILVVIIAAIFGFFYVRHSLSHADTDDAFIEGHAIPISPKVAAHVVKVAVDDNQEMKAEDLLVELDARDYLVRNDMAKAELEAAKAESEQAHQDVERYKQLNINDEVSKQQLDRAVLRANTADAKVDSAKARVKQTDLDVSYTKIFSPVAGHVTRKSVEQGEYVQIGQALMAIVPSEKWVIANFKETQLTRMRPGQEVKIKVDTYPGKTFKGHVDSIQRGTGARFSLLPPENATGNYVKVVQRVPVKIVFDEAPDKDHPLALGMSVVPEVDLS